MEKKKDGIGSFLKTILIGLVAALLVVQLIQPTIVVGESMENTYHDGDYLLIDKLSYRLHEPEYGDIIIFDTGDRYLIKRVIGKPGDTISIENGAVSRNGSKLSEPYTKTATEPEMEVKVEEDSYFCMGDNRGDSLDSRFEEIGQIDRDEIVGRVMVKLFSLPRY